MYVSFENLTMKYDERTVLDIDKGSVTSGKITGIIGPNGSGKTTLLNTISGLLVPTTGIIRYANLPANPSDDLEWFEKIPRRRITLVFQKPYLIDTSVEKNIAFPLKIRKWDKDKIHERTEELVNLFGLKGLEKQRATRMSSGEMQKTAIARALSFSPSLLMLDEPTSNIDPGSTDDIEKILSEYRKNENINIIIVSHNLAQVKRLCDNVMMMHDGKVIETGTADDVLSSPEHLLTRKFISKEALLSRKHAELLKDKEDSEEE